MYVYIYIIYIIYYIYILYIYIYVYTVTTFKPSGGRARPRGSGGSYLVFKWPGGPRKAFPEVV